MSSPVIASVHPDGGRLGRRWIVVSALLVLSIVCGWGATSAALASTGAETKLVRYRGYSVVVPASWPVYRLAVDPTMCVRFNRNAVYLGQPGTQQRCPSHSVGRTEAILIEPGTGAGGSAHAASAVPSVSEPQAQGGPPSSAQFRVAAHGVTVTATWGEHPAIVARALGVHSLPPAWAATSLAAQAASATTTHAARAAAAPIRAAGGDPVYTGPGFEACSAPSAADMTAWRSSPYDAVGIYIGGTNMACSQPNLTAAWVANEEAAGWHLIPTYVGLQAAGNSCGCAAIDPGQATVEGTAAATDAVSDAQALGIGPGNPIYVDMEAYTPGGVTSSAVLTFLAAWTGQLHADRYKSGLYVNAGSGVGDLVAEDGPGYEEPDDIWFADWNGEPTTSSWYIPAGDWSDHQRLHQYDGGVNATYGGITINIDDDYIDGAVAGASVATGAKTRRRSRHLRSPAGQAKDRRYEKPMRRGPVIRVRSGTTLALSAHEVTTRADTSSAIRFSSGGQPDAPSSVGAPR